MELEIEKRNDVCVLHFKGRFVTGTDPEYLHRKSEEIRSMKCSKILADLHEVPSMGSTGIGFVVAIYTSVIKNESGRFVMTGATPRVKEVFDLTRLATVIPSARDLESGIEVLSR
jgi:anti-anti-sigma factor